MEKEIIKIELSRILIKIGALKFGTFKLTSGKISPYYLDLRIIPSFPNVYKKICDFYIKIIKNEIGISNIDRSNPRTEGFRIKLVDDMQWCINNPIMRKWGAKPAKKPLRHRPKEESLIDEIFENKGV